MTDVDLAIAVAAVGAAVVHRRFGTTLERLDKGGGDFATDADVEAEAAMLTLLLAERPHDAILGEETGRTGASDSARTWLIDPLCGTLNFAARMAVVAVNVALRTGSGTIAAAVADPFTNEIFWTDGQAAMVRVHGEDSIARPDANSNLVDLNFDPPFPNAPAFRATRLADDPGFVERFRPRVVSTSLALTMVAVGRRAAYVTDGTPQGSVHFAAGLAICEAAGCVVTDLKGEPWGRGPTGLIVAANPEVHAALLRLVRRQF
jgi:myo-inositol-1(or 4)-monophosphatase